MFCCWTYAGLNCQGQVNTVKTKGGILERSHDVNLELHGNNKNRLRMLQMDVLEPFVRWSAMGWELAVVNTSKGGGLWTSRLNVHEQGPTRAHENPQTKSPRSFRFLTFCKRWKTKHIVCSSLCLTRWIFHHFFWLARDPRDAADSSFPCPRTWHAQANHSGASNLLW